MLHHGAVLLLCLSFLSGIAQSETASRLFGKVTAQGKSVVPNAVVTLVVPPQIVLDSTSTNDKGEFRFQPVPPGNYILRVKAPGFVESRIPIRIDTPSLDVKVDLQVAATHEEITVTATRDGVETTFRAPQPVNLIDSSELSLRANSVIAQAAQEEEGVHLQRTSPTVSGIFIRGLTGNRVSVYVDGVRFSTSAQRGGINTFLNLNQASSLDSIEIVRGASSAQYGSDAIGGTVQLVGLSPSLSDTPRFSGRYGAVAGTADASYGTNAQLFYSRKRFGALLGLDGFRANRLRPGSGVDSHSAFTRFFGLPSPIFIGPRLPDTAFTQYGGVVKTVWSPVSSTQLTTSYTRSQLDGGRRYDQLLGGDGNLIADLRNLMSDQFYVRLNRLELGVFDRATVGYSYNVQREERVNQGGNGNPNASITHEPERMRVQGVQGSLGKSVHRAEIQVGAEYYSESIRSPSYAFDPVTGISTVRRGRIPDGATYKSGGAYLQAYYSPLPRLNVTGAVRYGAASYLSLASDSPLVNGQPLWPDDSLRAGSWTYRVGAVYSPVDLLAFFANVSRGFRVPHMTDLGTLGLTGSGFEVAAPDVEGMDATIGDSASRTAVSSGLPVIQLQPETSQNYEVGIRTRGKFLNTSFSGFINDINDSITKQALILPQGAVGLTLGGVPITAQGPTGTVFVDATSNPVLVRANWDDARIWGLEYRSDLRLGARWNVGAVFTYIHAADKRTGLAPNFEGGTPAPDGFFSVRYTSARGRWWIEPYLHAANSQERLSTLDLEDRRTGATRSRSSIQNFFRRGATVRGYVSPGSDLIFGNADDQLLATGETLAQIQDRVLGTAASAPLYDHVPGYIVFNLRGGFQVAERHSIIAEFENIGDRTYRGISWGIDAPGRSLLVRYNVAF